MNAVQLSETTADLQNPSSSGINVYKMLHSSGPGAHPPYRKRRLPHCTPSWCTPASWFSFPKSSPYHVSSSLRACLLHINVWAGHDSVLC